MREMKVVVAIVAAEVVTVDVAIVRHRLEVDRLLEEVIESSFARHLVDRVSVNDSNRQRTCEHADQLSSDRIGEYHPRRNETKTTGGDIAVLKEEAFLGCFLLWTEREGMGVDAG